MHAQVSNWSLCLDLCLDLCLEADSTENATLLSSFSSRGIQSFLHQPLLLTVFSVDKESLCLSCFNNREHYSRPEEL